MDWKTRIEAAFAADPRIPDHEVIEELAHYARSLYETARADGRSHEEADARVIQEVDRWRADASALRHRSRRAPVIEPPPAAGPSHFAGLAQDLRYAIRLLRRQPRFALLVSLTMALGICATTALFSVTYGVLIKPLPWPAAEDVVQLKETRGGNAPRFGAFTNAAYLAWREDASTIEGLAAWSQRMVTLGGAGDPERVRITTASASLFPVLGLRPLIGDLFTERNESAPVVVIAEGLWRQRFGADPAVLGKLVQLDGQAYTIIGVLPDAFAFPDRQSRAWVPFVVRPASGNFLSMFNAIARLKPGVTAAQAAAEGTGRGRFAADTGMATTAIFGGAGPIEISAEPLRAALTTDVRQPLIVLLTAVVLLLVTATANVASLQLARATTRRREMAIRAALGAGSARVTRQLLVESLLLGFLGGGAGLALAWILHRVMPALLPADFPRIDDLGIDSVVVLFAVGTSVLTGVLFGLIPALRLRRLNLVESLSEDGAAPVGAGSRSRTAQARMIIMGGQVAIACVLLVGASLLGRSFLALLHADRGFDPADVMTARLSFPAAAYTEERRFAVVGQILDRLTAHPAVAHAGFTSELPLTPGGSSAAFSIPSRTGGGMVHVQASPRIVSPRFFSAIGMRLVAGRGFADSDTETSQIAVIVNRAFAQRYLGDAPLGVRLPMAGYSLATGESVESTVIGVVDDVRYLTAGTVSQPELYYSHRQFARRLRVPVVTLLVRTSNDPAPLAEAIRSAIREADAGLAPDAVRTLEERLMTTLARPRLYAVLLGGFAAFALAIAAVGLFGVLSYTVAQRSRELALRSALGARQVDIVSLVVRQGLAVTAAGLIAGMTGSLWLTRAIATQLYGVTTHDAVTYAVVPVVLSIVAALACFAPARRAARLDPLTVLRGS
jgi:putative ABC transport system permease protein